MEKNELDWKPEMIAIVPLRSDRYGTVEGLDRDELLAPDELERLVYLQMYEPLLALPVSGSGRFSGFVRPVVDVDGFADFGAFDSVDFKRQVPSFDKSRYKIYKLRDELADAVVRLNTVSSRIESNKKYLMMKYLKEGIIELDDIQDRDLWCMGNLYLRTLRLKQEIKEIRQNQAGKMVYKYQAPR